PSRPRSKGVGSAQECQGCVRNVRDVSGTICQGSVRIQHLHRWVRSQPPVRIASAVRSGDSAAAAFGRHGCQLTGLFSLAAACCATATGGSRLACGALVLGIGVEDERAHQLLAEVDVSDPGEIDYADPEVSPALADADVPSPVAENPGTVDL